MYDIGNINSIIVFRSDSYLNIIFIIIDFGEKSYIKL